MKYYKANAKAIYSSYDIAEEFIQLNKHWFEETTNSMYGYEERVRAYLKHWAKTDKFGNDNDDKNLIYVEMKFTEYLESCYYFVQDDYVKKEYEELPD